MAGATYRAYQAVGGGKLELVDRPVEEPATGMVRVAVEACGICHTDTVTVEGGFPGLKYPRVPGHEAVGRIDALGVGVTRWKLGQRVGAGFLAGRCGECPSCRWLFLDTSRNGRRRWCSMATCGSRIKARRHYAHKTGQGDVD